jgi:hypothetical protein
MKRFKVDVPLPDRGWRSWQVEASFCEVMRVSAMGPLLNWRMPWRSWRPCTQRDRKPSSISSFTEIADYSSRGHSQEFACWPARELKRALASEPHDRRSAWSCSRSEAASRRRRALERGVAESIVEAVCHGSSDVHGS